MKYLMISSYPPMKCGIGVYAYQMSKSLENEGELVDVLSPIEGGGDIKTDLRGYFNILKVLQYSRRCDKIILQYHEAFYYADRNLWNLFSIFCTHISFIFLFFLLKDKIEVIVHEIPYVHTSKVDCFLEKMKWRICQKMVFHTHKEVEIFESAYFRLSPDQYIINCHNRYFLKYCEESRNESRRKLGISTASIIFLCIGFIQPHKGFDIALNSFKDTKMSMELYVVGSLRVQWGDYIDYLNNLVGLSKEIPNAHVVNQYLTDEEFDRWINASDVIVIPYKEIWSSGVVARAKLFEKPVIARNTGGLKDQLEKTDLVFDNDADLGEIFMQFSSFIGAVQNL